MKRGLRIPVLVRRALGRAFLVRQVLVVCCFGGRMTTLLGNSLDSARGALPKRSGAVRSRKNQVTKGAGLATKRYWTQNPSFLAAMTQKTQLHRNIRGRNVHHSPGIRQRGPALDCDI